MDRPWESEGNAMTVKLNINGAVRVVDIPADKPLLWVLREDLDLRGTKFGCGAGICGACTVIADGAAIRSCQLSAGDAMGLAVTTIEAVAKTDAGKRISESWIALDVPQCGYCQAGQIMSATALLAINPKPGQDDIDAAMTGNICRCATYVRIRAAIMRAAQGGEQGKTDVDRAA